MLIELMAASLLSSSDPEGVVATAPRGLQAVPVASAASLAETVADASPAVTLQTAAPHGLNTDEQITRWLGERQAVTAASGASADPWGAQGVDQGQSRWSGYGTEAEPRRIRGEVSVGMGTGGYRDYAAAVSLPMGDTGTVNVSVSQTKNAPWASPYGYGPYGYGSGSRFGGHGFGVDGWGYGAWSPRGAAYDPWMMSPYSGRRASGGVTTSVSVSAGTVENGGDPRNPPAD